MLQKIKNLFTSILVAGILTKAFFVGITVLKNLLFFTGFRRFERPLIPASILLETIKEQGTEKGLRFKTHRSQTQNVYGICTYCLLYTSPSQRDRTRSRMPSSA